MSVTLHFLNSKLLLCLLVTLSQHYFTFATSKPTFGLSIRAILDDSPGSPLYLIENLTRAERVERFIKIKYARANYSDLVSRSNAKVVHDNIRIPILRDYLFYVSLRDLWHIPCSRPLCHGDDRLYDCVNGECVYDVLYGGGATTRGAASLESFQFYISNADTKTFTNVIFGCSNDNSDFLFDGSDVSGIFGLSKSPDSMASQFSPLTHTRFSYCFGPFSRCNASSNHPRVRRGHSAAASRTGFHPDTFRIRPDGSGGCFIDSGTLVSQIDFNTLGVNAYEAVMRVLEAYYGSRKLERTTVLKVFELCYKSPANYHDFAAITFHFNGANYSVDGEHGLFFDPVQGFFCVGILRGRAGLC
ncbi:aspartic proteinase nepenthesin-2-like [Durio zibethinus]|uniref:Aspartic proteinase nepenthesin-2-like n=1 Tax=Durio zibethinus TaxID=66656 RepID=A0A6P5ZML7_DURZI|nr:aspartic proteinase nepenthesin-2-like [Durio zibethinus]